MVGLIKENTLFCQNNSYDRMADTIKRMVGWIGKLPFLLTDDMFGSLNSAIP